MLNRAFENPDVEAVFSQYPTAVYDKLQALRNIIYSTASTIDGVGQLEETLKWGQPSYLTSETKSGTTVRIDQLKNDPSKVALYVSCQTTLIDTFRSRYPDLNYEGNRAIHFAVDDELPVDVVEECIGMILTYHLNKRKAS